MAEHTPISGRTKMVALIGSPVAHSLSPEMHNFSFNQLGIDARYFAFDVQTDDLPVVIPAMKAMGFAGANVTMPCKNTVIPYLDELSDAARLEQAVNVIEFRDGKALTKLFSTHPDTAERIARLREQAREMRVR